MGDGEQKQKHSERSRSGAKGESKRAVGRADQGEQGSKKERWGREAHELERGEGRRGEGLRCC